MVSYLVRNSPNLAGDFCNFALSCQGKRFLLLDGNLIYIKVLDKTIIFDFILVIFVPGSHQQAGV